MGIVLASTLAPEESLITVELGINVFQPVWQALLKAEKPVAQRGQTIGYEECTVTDEENRLVAKASTCVLLRKPEAAFCFYNWLISQRASWFDELRETASASLRLIRKTKRKPPARRYHALRPDACCLLSFHVAKIRLEPRGTLEISVKKAKQEWRLTANAGKK
jgi:hypothetical protein